MFKISCHTTCNVHVATLTPLGASFTKFCIADSPLSPRPCTITRVRPRTREISCHTTYIVRYRRFTCSLRSLIGYPNAIYSGTSRCSGSTPTIPLRRSFLIHMELLDINKRDHYHVQHVYHLRGNIKIGPLFGPYNAKCGPMVSREFRPSLVVMRQLYRTDKHSRRHQSGLTLTTTVSLCIPHLYERPSGPVNVRFL